MKGDCYFCQKGVREIDFKETELLKQFVSGMAKIRTRKKTGACSKHQRKLAIAIKRARYLGLLPFTKR
jgi:small subunit ribosomal protein S18